MIENIDFRSYSWDELVETPLGIDYSLYRGWVYVSVKHFREPDVLDLRGGESDEFDPISRHFIARDQGNGKIVGCTRVIPGGVGVQLPATHHFPGCLTDRDLDVAGIGEVSRFISTASGQRIRRDVALLLIRELAVYSLSQNRNHVVFVVERPLGRWLASLGVPLEALDDEQWIDEENGCLTPFLVDLKECDRALADAHRVYEVSSEQDQIGR